MPLPPKDACLADLKRRILSLDLAPGAALDEARLAEHYGVSRTPMREVLQRLTGLGFAVMEDNRGAKVASMNIAAMRTFFQTAPLIYASIARLAAENRPSAQLVSLQETQDAFCTATRAKDANAASLANHRFHEMVGEMAHNPYLMAALSRMLIDHTRLSQTFYRPASDDEAALVDSARVQHDQMIDAIASRDADRATELTLRHWDLSQNRMERFVRPDPLPLSVATMETQE